jgi:peptide/nickel transport system substrate-binding protein
VGEATTGGSASERAEIRTFLIADVRGYTLFTQERGDEAAAKLAARFAGIAREVVAAHGGSVIELRGDEALAVFTSARQAILAAVAAQDRFLEETVADPALPFPVGIGLDVGEAVPLEGGYRGGALNLAARLCGQAGPGEILASQGVVHLARKVDGVGVIDKGDQHFKNISEPVRVFRLVSEQADPAAGFRELSPPDRRPGPVRMARRHPVVAGLVALAILATIAVPATLAFRSGGPAETIEGDALAMVDLDSGVLRGSVALGSRPGAVAVGDGWVWLTLPDRGTIQQIDPESMTVRDTIAVGADPAGIAVGFDSVWVANGGSSTVSRIDPATSGVVQTIVVPGGPVGIAVDDDGIWVASSFNSSVSRIDPASGEVVATVGVGDRPVDVAVDDAGVWVANAGSGTVSRLDPVRGLVVEEIGVGNGAQAITTGPEGIWVANTLDGTVSRIDPDTNAVAQTMPVGDEPADVLVSGASVWVTDGAAGSVTRIEPGSGMTTIPLGSKAGDTAAGDGAVWVSVRGSDAVHRGGTLTISGDVTIFDTLDPALAYAPLSWGILALTSDGLVAYRRTGGLDGATLVPNLARSLPEPTEGGRTYTFQLRTGIRYSTGDLVRPEDFRRGIERVFASLDAYGFPSGGTQYLSGILGADACEPGRHCNLSEGIVTDDAAGTVTFHLAEPDPDFLHRLAMPFASAVPAGTPDVLEGDPYLPATGPYMVEAYAEGEQVVLVRNPSFRSWSEAARPDGFPDRIEVQLEDDRGEMADEVLGGQSDLMYWLPEPGSVAGFASSHAGQLHLAPQPAIFYMSPDIRVPPFDDVLVRRAVNLAVDRAKVQRLIGLGTPPTCQILPPNFPGYAPYCPYTVDPGKTWTGPDLEAAKSLVQESETEGTKVTVWSAPNVFPSVARYFRDLLEELGYHATLNEVDTPTFQSAIFGNPRQAQVALTGWFTDYLSPSGFIVPTLACGAPSNISGFCDPDIDRRMERAARLQVTDPTAAHALWSEIDHDIVDQAAWIPLAVRQWVNLVSERAGNFQVHPQYGPLIDQMWVR